MEGLTFPPENGINSPMRRSAGAVERDGLENRCGGNPTQGSNPCFSASFLSPTVSTSGLVVDHPSVHGVTLGWNRLVNHLGEDREGRILESLVVHVP